MDWESVAVALDVSSKNEIDEFLGALSFTPSIVKIGLQLTSAIGIEGAISHVRARIPNVKIFLDLKLHDIPNTVSKAVTELTQHNIDWLTIHGLGGPAMLSAASKAAGDKVNLVVVTILTSHSQEEISATLGTERLVLELALGIAGQAAEAGIEWIVSSAYECPQIKATHPTLKCITPGIRLAGGNSDDQSRICTPEQAFDLGSDILVMGRSLRG